MSNKPYEAARLVDECFRALLDASINSQIFRGAFVEAGELSPMLRRFLLEEPRIQIRHGFWKTIQNLCSSGPKSVLFQDPLTVSDDHRSSAAPQDLILYIWRSLAAILPQTLFHAERSQQIFEASNLVVRALEPSTRQNLNVQDYNRAWCALLLEHHHTEVRIYCENSASRALIVFRLLVATRLTGWFLGCPNLFYTLFTGPNRWEKRCQYRESERSQRFLMFS